MTTEHDPPGDLAPEAVPPSGETPPESGAPAREPEPEAAPRGPLARSQQRDEFEPGTTQPALHP